jgi:hypothetical protein
LLDVEKLLKNSKNQNQASPKGPYSDFDEDLVNGVEVVLVVPSHRGKVRDDQVREILYKKVRSHEGRYFFGLLLVVLHPLYQEGLFPDPGIRLDQKRLVFFGLKKEIKNET